MNKPEISLAAFDKAYQLQAEIQVNNREVVTFKGHYVLRSAENKDHRWHEKIKFWYEAYVENKLDNFTWEEYKNGRFAIYLVRKNDAMYKCSCYVGITKQPCKHALLMMAKDGLLMFPPEVTAHKLDEKRKRGRPKKVTKALLK